MRRHGVTCYYRDTRNIFVFFIQSEVLRIFSTLKRMLLTRGHLLVSAVGVYSYDWENNKISDDVIKRSSSWLHFHGQKPPAFYGGT